MENYVVRLCEQMKIVAYNPVLIIIMIDILLWRATDFVYFWLPQPLHLQC